MAIIKSIKTKIGTTGLEKTRIDIYKRIAQLNKKNPDKYYDENLTKRLKLNRKANIKKSIRRYYPLAQKRSKLLISQTVRFLERMSKIEKLKNAEFVFLDRDATPYLWISKELYPEYGFRKEQFKSGTITRKLKDDLNQLLFDFYNTHNSKFVETKEQYNIKLNEMVESIPKSTELENYKKMILSTLDLKKPIIFIDSGILGTNTLLFQLLVKFISPKTETYSALFSYTNKYRNYIDFDFTDDTDVFDIENNPRFVGTSLNTINQNNKIKIERQNLRKDPKDYSLKITTSTSNPASAEIFLIALRNQLARYKKEKGIN